jgi:hypothetical protein
MNRSHAGPATRTAPPDLARLIQHYESWRLQADHPDPDMDDDPSWPTVARLCCGKAREWLIEAITDTGLGYADHAGIRYRLADGDVIRDRIAPRSGPKAGTRKGARP